MSILSSLSTMIPFPVKEYSEQITKAAADHTGNVAPEVTWAGMTWGDTSVTPNMLKRRNADNTNWVIVGRLYERPLYEGEGGLLRSTLAGAPALSVAGGLAVDGTNTGASVRLICRRAVPEIGIRRVSGMLSYSLGAGGNGRSAGTAFLDIAVTHSAVNAALLVMGSGIAIAAYPVLVELTYEGETWLALDSSGTTNPLRYFRFWGVAEDPTFPLIPRNQVSDIVVVTTNPKLSLNERAVMIAGYEGFGGNASINLKYPAPTTKETNVSRIWKSGGADGKTPAHAASIHFAAGTNYGRLRVEAGASAKRVIVEGGNLTSNWSEYVHHSGNLHIESGVWTPEVFGTGNAGVYEYGTVYAHYQVVGKVVTLFAWIPISSVTTPGTGRIAIRGFPFTKRTHTATAGSVRLEGVTLGSDVVGVTPEIRGIAQAYDQIYLRATSRDGASDPVVGISSLSAGSLITFSFSYLIN